VAWRLFAVIVAALLMGLVFGGLRVAAAEDSASQFGRTQQLARLSAELLPVVDDLQNERDATLVALITNSSAGLGKLHAKTNSDLVPVRAALQQVVNGGFPAATASAAGAVNNALSTTSIAQLQGLFGTATPSGDVVSPEYGFVISDIISLQGQVSLGITDQSLNSDVATLTALSQARDLTSQQQAQLDQSLDNKAAYDGNATVTNLQVTYAEEFTQEGAFQSAATPAETGMYDSLLGPQAAKLAGEDQSDNIEQALFAVAGNPKIVSASGISYPPFITGQPLDPSATTTAAQDGLTTTTLLKAAWDKGTTAKLGAMQDTEQFVAGNVTARATQLLRTAQRTALIYLVITVLVLLLVLAAALLVARSVVLPLRRLREGALDVASVQLPERVRQLSDDPESVSTTDVAPINVVSQDEIGQVARAFDRVHSEAVRLAGEQAVQRTSFNAMFVNLSRRSQTLIERLARMIDNLEQNEADSGRLASLFSMDHLVTRMRRNSENLLLLAGHDNPRKWSDAVPLADVARAATSEIEQYNRVTLNVPSGVFLSGQSVSDVVHLLAELIENATIFSPKDTQVLVTLQELISGGVLLEVIDKGIGVSESRLEEMNWRLDNPPTMDVSVSRHMGLFAVARLAERHRIRIRLRPVQPQGLSALVWLPDNLLERTDPFVTATSSWSARSAGAAADVAMSGALTGAMTGGGYPAAPVLSAERPGDGSGGAGGYGAPAARTPSGWFRSGAIGARPSLPDFAPGPATGTPHLPAPGQASQTAVGLPVRTPRASQSGPAVPASAPGQDGQTPTGLPVRTPRASLSGGLGGPGGGSQAETGNRLLAGSGKALPQRSPEHARSRLAGFQRGTRRAEAQGGSGGQAPPAGEGTLS
jgi:signal transduction histidine kinase